MKYLPILLLLLFGCGRENSSTHRSIIGKWKMSDWDLYRAAYFNPDSSVVFDNHIDTIYRYRYRVDGDTLILLLNDGSLYRTSIIKLTNDSLVLNGLEKKQQILRYGRFDK